MKTSGTYPPLHRMTALRVTDPAAQGGIASAHVNQLKEHRVPKFLYVKTVAPMRSFMSVEVSFSPSLVPTDELLQ